METADVADLIKTLREQGADNLDVEAKASHTALPKSVKETLSAFANTNGGVILLGVAEEKDFEVVGVADAAKIASDLAAACAGDVAPPLRPVIQTHHLEGKAVVVAEIEAIEPSLRPCYVVSRGINKGSYTRVHDADQTLSTYEVQLLLGNRTQPKFDAEMVPDATVDDALDPAMVAAYVARVRDLRPKMTRGFTDDQLLIHHSLAAKDGDELRPTLAGLLALGSYPQKFYPQLMLTLVVYPTVGGADPESGVRFRDNVAIEGSIPVMAQETLDALKKNMRRRSTVVGVGRSETWEYPEAALREAVVNALVHRDLSPGARGAQVQIEMYPDRLSIRNPGGLYGPVSVAALSEASASDSAGTSSARNSYLLRALEDVALPGDDRTVCENRGSGMRTMVEALRSAGMSLPRFIDHISNFTLTVPSHALLDDETVRWITSLGATDLTDSQCIALAMLRSGDTLDNARYRAATRLDSRVATSELQDLVSRGFVVQLGQKRWTEYRLADSDVASTVTQAPVAEVPTASPRDLLLDALRARPASRAELVSITGLSKQIASRWLRILREEHLVRVSGDSPLTSPKLTYELTARGHGETPLPLDF